LDRLKFCVTLMALVTGNTPEVADVDCTLYGNTLLTRRFRPSRWALAILVTRAFAV
jgi:hypothetical protein